MKLELLSYVQQQYKGTDLSDVCLVACQHLLGTTPDMLEVLFSFGLKPSAVFVLGKCYSTNKSVFKLLSSRGVYVSQESSKFNFRLPYDEQFGMYLTRFLKFVLNSKNFRKAKKVLILDDGGQLIRSLSDQKLDFSIFAGVEQTTSGYESIRRITLRFPVVNVARSKLKLESESPQIAMVALQRLKKYLVGKKRILLIGSGSIGSNVYKILKNQHKITVRDYRKDRQLFPGKWVKTIGKYDVIIGATGTTVLDSSFFGFLKGKTILASVSSSDREFDSGYFRGLCSKRSSVHGVWEFQGTKLLNAGFPINFFGGLHSLPPVHAQLTRALLVAGVIQAYNSNGVGLENLNTDIQNLIATRYMQIIN